MTVRIQASELYRIHEADLRHSIEKFQEGNLPPTFKDSTRFDLLVNGYRRLPPKAVVATAARKPLGRVLTSEEFQGGETSTAFRLLLERGFEFATKLMNVAELDASFSVGRSRETTFVILESRGPDRNTNYIAGLEALLRGLADMDATIEDIFIDSAEARKLPVDQRRLRLRSQSYPFKLRAVMDLASLRRDITAAAAATGRGSDATGSGNPTKRLRLVFTEPQDSQVFRIASVLAQNRGAPVAESKKFAFHAKPPAPGGGQSGTRRAIDEIDVTYIHYQMQQSLYESLVAAHGADKVSCEAITCSGRPADIILELPTGYELFEIKTALAPRDCVRQAVGQLLEYAYWPGSPGFSVLWIVGPSPIDSVTQEHIDGLRERFGLPLSYCQQPAATPLPHES